MSKYKVNPISDEEIEKIISNSVQSSKNRLIGNAAETKKQFVKPIANLEGWEDSPSVVGAVNRVVNEISEAFRDIDKDMPLVSSTTLEFNNLGYNVIISKKGTELSSNGAPIDWFNRKPKEEDKFFAVGTSSDKRHFGFTAVVTRKDDTYLWFKMTDIVLLGGDDPVLRNTIGFSGVTPEEFAEKDGTGKYTFKGTQGDHAIGIQLFSTPPRVGNQFLGTVMLQPEGIPPSIATFTAVVDSIFYRDGKPHSVEYSLLDVTIIHNGSLDAQVIKNTDDITKLGQDMQQQGEELQEAISNASQELSREISITAQALRAEDSKLNDALNAHKQMVNTELSKKQDNLVFADGYNSSSNKVATETTVSKKVAEVVAGADTSFDTLKEIADWIKEHPKSVAAINALIKANSDKIAVLDEEMPVVLNACVYISGTTHDVFDNVSEETPYLNSLWVDYLNFEPSKDDKAMALIKTGDGYVYACRLVFDGTIPESGGRYFARFACTKAILLHNGATDTQVATNTENMPIVLKSNGVLNESHTEFEESLLNSSTRTVRLDVLNREPKEGDKAVALMKTNDKYVYACVLEFTGEIATDDEGVKWAKFSCKSAFVVHNGSIDTQVTTNTANITKLNSEMPLIATIQMGTPAGTKIETGTELTISSFSLNRAPIIGESFNIHVQENDTGDIYSLTGIVTSYDPSVVNQNVTYKVTHLIKVYDANTVKKTDIPTNKDAGPIKVSSLNYGLEYVASQNALRIKNTNTKDKIEDRASYNYEAVTLGGVDNYVSAVLTSPLVTMTDEEKAKACETIGALLKPTNNTDLQCAICLDKDGNVVLQVAMSGQTANGIAISDAYGRLAVASAFVSSSNKGLHALQANDLLIAPVHLTLTDEQKTKWCEMIGAVAQNTANSSTSQAYAKRANGTQFMCTITPNADNNTIPMRANGNFYVDKVTDPKHCANKEYVENIPTYFSDTITDEQKAAWCEMIGAEKMYLHTLAITLEVYDDDHGEVELVDTTFTFKSTCPYKFGWGSGEVDLALLRNNGEMHVLIGQLVSVSALHPALVADWSVCYVTDDAQELGLITPGINVILHASIVEYNDTVTVPTIDGWVKHN